MIICVFVSFVRVKIIFKNRKTREALECEAENLLASNIFFESQEFWKKSHKSDSFSLPYIRNFFLYFSERKRTVLLRVKKIVVVKELREGVLIFEEREKHVGNT